MNELKKGIPSQRNTHEGESLGRCDHTDGHWRNQQEGCLGLANVAQTTGRLWKEGADMASVLSSEGAGADKGLSLPRGPGAGPSQYEGQVPEATVGPPSSAALHTPGYNEPALARR